MFKFEIKRKPISSTVDETWIHHYTFKPKEQSKQWTISRGRAPRRAGSMFSVYTVMVRIFWNFKDISHIDNL